MSTLGCAALLAGTPGISPARLLALLDADPPHVVWARHGDGRDPGEAEAAHRAAGVEILLRDDPGFPGPLAADQCPPAVLFAQGDLDVLHGPRVAIVGTRRCTGAGAGFARELGRDLTAAGVSVVSGLALGIDGAAHRGVLDAGGRPIGVVGCGLDVVYPSRHADLWAATASAGLLLSEAPLGARPEAWRFPLRNRIIAALAHVVVVVESHAAGGSLHTVREADNRSIPIMAVPGSVRSPASAGANQLLSEGCAPARDAADVLVALGLTAAQRGARDDQRPRPDRVGRSVLKAFSWEPATLDHLALRTGLGVLELSSAIEALLTGGWIAQDGGWYERIGR